MVWRRVGVLLAGSGLAACSVSPVPEPPEARPSLHSVSIAAPCEGCTDAATVRGESGATSEASHVWAVNLDREDPPVTTPTNPDGSFQLSLPLAPGDALRLQARRGSARSQPRDFVILDPASDGFTERPPPACWSIPLEVDLGVAPVGAVRSHTLRLRALCSTPLVVDRVTLRAPSPAFSVSVAGLPRAITRGEFLDLPIRFSPPGDEPYEEVLLVDVGGDVPGRSAITLFGAGAP